jgi:azurin
MRSALAAIVSAAVLHAGASWGQECSLPIEGNDQIQYNKKELTVSSDCKKATVTLHHVGTLAANVMGHNWVLAATKDYMGVAQAAQAASPPDFVPDSDNRIIAHTPMIGGGEEVSVTFDLSRLEPGGDYTYFCSFPGHFAMMSGKFIVE